MSDRIKSRPKSTASAMTRSGNLNYSVIRPTDCWKTATNTGTLWNSENNTLLGINGSKITSHPWQMSINQHSGGFLPILKAKSRASTTKKFGKRNRSATARSLDAYATTGGKIVAASPASLLDLSTMVPPTTEKQSIAKLYRENSFPLNISVITPPVLRYSHESDTESVLAKLDILEGNATSQKTDNTLSNSMNEPRAYRLQAAPTLKRATSNIEHTIWTGNEGDSTSITQQASRIPAPPNTPRTLGATNAYEGDTTDVTVDTFPPRSDSKWKLNVTLPTKDSTTGDVQMTNLSNEIDLIQEINNPKSILKPLNEPNPEPVNKRTLELSTYMLTTPLPPTVRPSSSNVMSPLKKRVLRKKSADKNQALAQLQKLENLTDTISDSSSTTPSQDLTESDSGNPDSSDSKTSELIKSVRFLDNPAKIKEYYPWEPPQHSLVHDEINSPVPTYRKPVKTSPIFRP